MFQPTPLIATIAILSNETVPGSSYANEETVNASSTRNYECQVNGLFDSSYLFNI